MVQMNGFYAQEQITKLPQKFLIKPNSSVLENLQIQLTSFLFPVFKNILLGSQVNNISRCEYNNFE